MNLVTRQPGERRRGMLDGFPYNGHCDQHERRCGLDRRKSPASLEDLWGLFPEPPPDEPGQNL